MYQGGGGNFKYIVAKYYFKVRLLLTKMVPALNVEGVLKLLK